MRFILSGKIILFALLLIPQLGKAQWNNSLYDLRKWNLGFTMGINAAYVRFVQGMSAPDPVKKNVAKQVTATPSYGINLGLICNVRLQKYLDLRFIPAVSLQQRSFTYLVGDSSFTRRLEASYMEIPLYLRFKSQFYHNHRVYVMTGLKYSNNLMSERRLKDDPDLVKIDNHDFSWEFAAGVNIYGDRVLLSPEIRYSLGMRNIYTPDFTDYSSAIKMITTHSILICLNFE
ncbi:MAG: PorT family protein [Bacteroidetes bacterium]|nr:PorT family protein [Bacteroidota bacterium]